MARCHVCGAEDPMAFRCSFCNEYHCSRHRLPEAHLCANIDAARRRDPVVVREADFVGERPRAWNASITPKPVATRWLLGIIAGVFVLELFLVLTRNAEAFGDLFVLSSDYVERPWTLATSVLAHASLQHFLLNALVLFFFGPVLETRMGTRRFLLLFWSSGVLAGAAQVAFSVYALGIPEPNVVGASGALMGLLGALTVLAPRLRVLIFFIVPASLWIITIGYAILDLLPALLGVRDGIAHVAHLAGLGLGLFVGKLLRDQGFAFPGQVGMAPGQRW